MLIFLKIYRKKGADGRDIWREGALRAFVGDDGQGGGFRAQNCDRPCRRGLSSAAAAQTLPGGFVFLRDIDPSIIQDIRYAGANNFVGRRLSGYEAAECVVKREVGLALQRVQRELEPQNLSLKMLDCYRPKRAVHDMVMWAQDGRETPAGRRYNPVFTRRICFDWAISPRIPAIPPAPRST